MYVRKLTRDDIEQYLYAYAETEEKVPGTEIPLPPWRWNTLKYRKLRQTDLTLEEAIEKAIGYREVEATTKFQYFCYGFGEGSSYKHVPYDRIYIKISHEGVTLKDVDEEVSEIITRVPSWAFPERKPIPKIYCDEEVLEEWKLERKLFSLVDKYELNFKDVKNILEQVDEEVVETKLRDIKLEREREAFLRIKEELLERNKYVGEYIAVHEGRIVDHDRDRVELTRRVYAQYGHVPIYIDQVVEKEKVVRFPSPRVSKNNN